MKTFEGSNYYEILDISPGADAAEVKRAYRQAVALYDADALATYSLFADDERDELLQAIETAYDTLMDKDKRAAYNQMLLNTGQMDESFFSLTDRKHLAARAEGVSTSTGLSAWVEKKSAETRIKTRIDELLAGDVVSGTQLRAIREALGIEPSEIYEIAKISTTVLAMIEDNRFEELPAQIFLKQFLSSYAEILQLDSQRIVAGYLKNMADRSA